MNDKEKDELISRIISTKEGRQKIIDIAKETGTMEQLGNAITESIKLFANPPRVVHCKKENFDVYVGRPTKFGNPFSHKDGTLALYKVANRDEAVEKYEEWLLSQPELVAAVKAELKGKILACWCAPLSCHGDVLLKVANS